MKSWLVTFFYHFRYENVVRFKNKCAPAAVNRWFLSISTISSPSQSRETVPLKIIFVQRDIENRPNLKG